MNTGTRNSGINTRERCPIRLFLCFIDFSFNWFSFGRVIVKESLLHDHGLDLRCRWISLHHQKQPTMFSFRLFQQQSSCYEWRLYMENIFLQRISTSSMNCGFILTTYWHVIERVLLEYISMEPLILQASSTISIWPLE
jgi:hypothetical protein